jgi:tetratricopeptide (TPR) repeat protein
MRPYPAIRMTARASHAVEALRRLSGIRLRQVYCTLQCVMCAAVVTVITTSRATAEPRALAQSARLYRVARAPETAQVERLRGRAQERTNEGLRAFPGGFRAICERTQALPLPADNPAVQQGRRRALQLLARQAVTRKLRLDAALLELDRARALAPHDPDVGLLRVRVLSLWEDPVSLEPCRVRDRSAEAAHALRELLTRTPELRSSESLLELGLLFARHGAYAEAAAAYRRSIALALDPQACGVAYGQLAEVTMLAGDPARARPLYQHALRHISKGPDAARLSIGLAVALTRLGEHTQAVQQARGALEQSDRSLSPLGPDQVLFDPAEERAIYEAIALEALAQLQPETKTQSLQSAAERYTAFLSEAGPTHIYRLAAEADLNRVVDELSLTRNEVGER